MPLALQDDVRRAPSSIFLDIGDVFGALAGFAYQLVSPVFDVTTGTAKPPAGGLL
jgi:hypothetical protein